MRSAGFRVVAASYTNCLPAVAAEIAGRFRIRGGTAVADGSGIPRGEGCDPARQPPRGTG